MKSWKKFLPDYEIIEWNESNFDVNINAYCSEAYAAKKFAFVSDYARFWVLYNHGGLYLDVDVEIIKGIDDIVSRGPFMGCERASGINKPPEDLNVAPGLGIGAEKGAPLLKEVLDHYDSIHFLNGDGTPNLKTVVMMMTEILVKHGLVNIPDIQKCGDMWIYPKEYFCPIIPALGLGEITPNSRSIHHYAGSWLPPKKRFKDNIVRILGPVVSRRIGRMKYRIKKTLNFPHSSR